MLYESHSRAVQGADEGVLILIIMEYALWVNNGLIDDNGSGSLNPYYNGICSMR